MICLRMGAYCVKIYNNFKSIISISMLVCILYLTKIFDSFKWNWKKAVRNRRMFSVPNLEEPWVTVEIWKILDILGLLYWRESNQSIQFWSGFIPINGSGWIYPTLTAISPTPTLHVARFMSSSISKLTLLLSFSTCVLHVFFGRPRFLLPFISN